MLEAIGNNAPASVPLAPKAKVTSNGVQGKIESSPVWGPARRIPYRLVFSDPVTGSAVFYGVVTNSYERPAGMPGEVVGSAPEGAGDSWWYYVLRIKVVDKKITEVEQLDFTPKDGRARLGGDPEPASARSHLGSGDSESERGFARRALHGGRQVLGLGFQAHQDQRGALGPGCQRLESGSVTSDSPNFPWSCGNGMNQPAVFWNVQNQRYYIADVERGVVLGFAVFMTPPQYPENVFGLAIEFFKVENGLIRAIDAFSRTALHEQHSGWGAGPGS